MNTVEHIKQCIYEIKRLEDTTLEDAFNKFLSFCAYESGVLGAVFKANIKTSKYLHSEFSVTEIIGYDYLGEAFKDLGFAKSKSIKEKINDDDKKVHSALKILDESLYHDGVKIKIPTVFITNVGTGRILFAVHHRHKEVIIYAHETDKILYKIALVNITLNKLPVKILNILENPSKTNPASEEWQYSNSY